jgi:hypothetical protein
VAWLQPATLTPGRTQARAIVLRFLARTTSMVVLLTTAYYIWPSRSPIEDLSAAARLAGVVVSLLLVALVARAQLRAIRRAPRLVTSVEALLTSLYFLVVVFATVYYRVATSTDQFAGLQTKTDGLYFTVTVFSTVGFGDIHAAGTAARAMVTVQMLFSLMYIGTAIRLLGGVRSQQAAPPPAAPEQNTQP